MSQCAGVCVCVCVPNNRTNNNNKKIDRTKQKTNQYELKMVFECIGYAGGGILFVCSSIRQPPSFVHANLRRNCNYNYLMEVECKMCC